MNDNELIEFLFGSYKDYLGTGVTKALINSNPEFRNFLIQGIVAGKINGFSEEFLESLRILNMRGSGTLIDAFEQGLNIGACTTASRLCSFAFHRCQIAGGVNKYLIGTKNSTDGSHTWIVGSDGNIYDTSFMLVINKSFGEKMGYDEQNIYDPNLDQYYRVAKEYATDANLRR